MLLQREPAQQPSASHLRRNALRLLRPTRPLLGGGPRIAREDRPKHIDKIPIGIYTQTTLLNEGRQPVTPVGGAGCGARGHGFVGHAPGGPRDSALRASRPVREELAERPAPGRAGAQTRSGVRAVRLEPRTQDAAGRCAERRLCPGDGPQHSVRPASVGAPSPLTHNSEV